MGKDSYGEIVQDDEILEEAIKYALYCKQQRQPVGGNQNSEYQHAQFTSYGDTVRFEQL